MAEGGEKWIDSTGTPLFKFILSFSALAVGASVIYYFFFYVPASAHLQNESQQCSQLASAVFTQWGYTSSSTSLGITASYTYHYNNKLGKCFILLDTAMGTTADMTYGQDLSDALTGTKYAEYTETDDWTGSVENNFPTCAIYQPKQSCSSQADFDSYIKAYLN